MSLTVGNEWIVSSRLLIGYVLSVTFILGTVMGSFIHCLSERTITHESIWRGRSHCDFCGHVLAWRDLIPIVSYVALRGHCRYCQKKISSRNLWTEIILGVAFVVNVIRFGLSPSAIRTAIAACILMMLSLVDLDSCQIPNRAILALAINYLVFLPFMKVSLAEQLIRSGLGAIVIGGGMLLIVWVFDQITGQEGMGGGDIKLFFVAGLYLGTAVGLLCVILSCVIGLVFSAWRKNRRIPFGPSLSIAFYLCLLFGDSIVQWYMTLVGIS